MGKAIIVRGADFSQNAIGLNDMFDTLYAPSSLASTLNNDFWVTISETYQNQKISAIRLKVADGDYSNIDALKLSIFKVSYEATTQGSAVTVLQRIDIELEPRQGFHDVVLPETIDVGTNHIAVKCDTTGVGNWLMLDQTLGTSSKVVDTATMKFGSSTQTFGIGLATYGSL